MQEIIYSHKTLGPIARIFVEQNLLYVFIALGIVYSFFWINKFSKEHFDRNLAVSLVATLRGKSKEDKNRISREIFFEKSTQREFVMWQESILEKIYHDLHLVDLFDKKHMAVAHKAAEELYYPFDDKLKELGQLVNLDVPELLLDKQQKHYNDLLSGIIKRPNQIGFELDEYIVNDHNEIVGFKANVCQYKHTVLTSHILEYELFKTYKSLGKRFSHNTTAEEILSFLPRRQKIHLGQTNEEIMIKGKNRHSLLSVQMIIIAYWEKIDKYCTLIVKRSDKVAMKPNYYHIIPAGGYEIFEKEGTSNKYIIKKNFDIELTLFRELLEEVFNGKDYEENENGEAKEIIYKHPDIIDLEEMLNNQTAFLQCLGNVTDLLSLRQELSFLLMVDNAEFMKKNFKFNFEATDLQIVPLEDLSEFLTGELLYPSSAGLLELVKTSKLIKERNLEQYF
jgi:hypothetical protein